MGRYYHGDIDGKFWVAVQSSTDADFFGVEGAVTHVNYYFTKEHLDKVKKGIEDCENCLGEYKEHLDNFFKDRDYYSDKKLAEYLNDNTDRVGNHTEDGVKFYLEWYARLDLGKEILACMEENGECSFQAEL
tara:strand:+ start:395 stop:790 length:396 start_codon:yes stop_codon:yes gene_type:complete